MGYDFGVEQPLSYPGCAKQSMLEEEKKAHISKSVAEYLYSNLLEIYKFGQIENN